MGSRPDCDWGMVLKYNFVKSHLCPLYADERQMGNPPSFNMETTIHDCVYKNITEEIIFQNSLVCQLYIFHYQVL